MLVCFDIGGSAIKMALINEGNELLEKKSLEVKNDIDYLFGVMSEQVNHYKTLYPIEGIAISAPGAVDVESGIIYGTSAIPVIHGPNFKTELQARTGLAVAIENDANCAALAEMYYGAAKDNQDVCVFVIGTGVGGTIVKDKKVHHGNALHGGEFGYMLIPTKEGYGTLSHVGAVGALVRRGKEIFQDEAINGRKIFELASHDERAKTLVDEFYTYLAMGTINIQYIYNPEKILFGGAVSEREDFIERIKEKMQEIQDRNYGNAQIWTPMETCQFKNDANLLGAKVNFLQMKGEC